MTTTLNFKDNIDQFTWRFAAPAISAMAAGGCVAWDNRNSNRNTPYNYILNGAALFSAYSPLTNEFIPLPSPALAGTFGAGAACVMHPTQGPRGTLAAGATTTSVILTTALPAAVAANQLANRGDGEGFTIRIISPSSGKTEARQIIANTAGTTPTITLDSALTFTPAVGDLYEIRSGRVYLLSAGTLAAGIFRAYDIATNSYITLAQTNLPATIGGDSSMVALSEGHCPSDATDSNVGYFGNITSAAGNTSTTINASSGALPATLFANEYRNFQIRIINDPTNLTSVGQRRRITSHTSGATATFTVPTWTVTPSAAATFVIENDDDKILLFTNQTAVYNYNITANTWDTSTWAAAAAAGGAGIVAAHSHGILRDPSGNARHSFIYRIRGGNTNIIDVLDIAGGATGVWSSDIAYGNRGTLFNTGTCGANDPITNGGKYLNLNINGTQRHARFDMRNRVLEPLAFLHFGGAGATHVGGRLGMCYFFDGATKLGILSNNLCTSTSQVQLILQK
ncbi:hypothetical protein SCRM01_022 [Synechococcus phage S-CRM01]|uniref:hypothetical protein n=1 Tax=Synechococcus phage S-CRM01 TaxID=1026955 RepID=UPI000209E340|nr:hypothetical protein SCRM01_022 [Synechococcus phage S-CRM01]AEC52969.1 hypothetical protein SCRM01_022 [Synechococcus phage S-CRM01]